MEPSKHPLDANGAHETSVAKRQKLDEASSVPPINTNVFLGKVVLIGDGEDYKGSRQQYATSEKFSNTNPAAIIYAKRNEGHDDIMNAIDYAKTNGLAVAVRSGGHQYLGFSSTGGNNIQIGMGGGLQPVGRIQLCR
jgi:hypothetical protein